MNKYFDLNNGRKIPAIGLGTTHVEDEEISMAGVEVALNAGFRYIDTAYATTKAEVMIGKILEKWLGSGKIKREELFITTKLPPTGMTPEKVRHFLKLSLKNLKLDYVDMYLFHGPVGFKYSDDDLAVTFSPDGKPMLDMNTSLEDVWKAMEQQVDAGLAKSIGISNCNISQIERLVKVAKIKPANLQVEMNAYFQQKPLQKVCKHHGIVITGFSVLGSPGKAEGLKAFGVADAKEVGLVDDPVVNELAQKYKKTSGQILLKFLVQQGHNVVTRSGNPERLKQNLEIFNFDLSDEDMEAMKNLDKGLEGRGHGDLRRKMFSGHPEFQEDEF